MPARRERGLTRPQNKKPDKDGAYRYLRYSPELAEKICQRLAAGEYWIDICNTRGMPAYATLYLWKHRYPDFAEALAQAREAAADLRADKVLEIADATTPQTVSADRLKVSAYRWRAATGAPHLYSSSVRGRIAEPGANAPRHVIIEVRRFETVTGPDGLSYVRELPRLEDGTTDGSDDERG